MKPQKLYSLTDLLDYFLGTQGKEIWEIRTEIKEWFLHHHIWQDGIRICEITDHPYHTVPIKSQATLAFCEKCLEEFGICDYEIRPLGPCGGWKFLKIVVN
jgi:hypothetical protein